MVRCKFQLTEIRQQHWSPTARTYIFNAVGDDGIPENQKFCRYTPNGRFEMMIDNPPAQEMFKLGGYYYFDASPVEATPVVEAPAEVDKSSEQQ